MDNEINIKSLAWDIISVISGYIIFCGITVIKSVSSFHIAAPFFYAKYTSFPYPNWFIYISIGFCFYLLIFLLFNPFRRSSEIYGGAHWAQSREIKKFGLYEKQGVILGEKFGKYIRTDAPLSTLVYAPPGTGKTAGIIIPSLLSCDNSVIAHDPKSELFEKTSKYRAGFSRIIKFSPGDSDSAKWNPLSKKELPEEWPDIEKIVSQIAHSFFTSEKNKEDSMWVREARSMFIFWALFLIATNGETSFPEIFKKSLTLDEAPDLQSVIALEIEEKKEILPDRVTLEGNALIAKAEREFSGVLGTYKSYMNIFSDSRVAKNLSRSDFSLKDLRKEKTSIYLTVKNADQTRLKPILTLFFEAATLAALDHEPKPDEESITLFIDEFVRLGRMKEVLEMSAIGRSYRINAVFVCQSISQLIDIYSKEGADKLKNTCAYHCIFTQNEAQIARDISESIGKKTRKRKSKSKQATKFFGSVQEGQEGIPLILPQEIMSLPKDKVLILVQNNFQTPILAKPALWFQDKTLSKFII
ncbi:MAG: type IV secretory system conjugative DNA transfer family protein [Deltaproteobacteria bacterium]|nr:type IV secretory system conjugative DNA transfer family protein [Deltaproteobacteria bacterium]